MRRLLQELGLAMARVLGCDPRFCSAVFQCQSFRLAFVRREVERLSCQSPSLSLLSPSTPLLPPFHILLEGGVWSMLDLLLSMTPSQLHGTFVPSIEEALLDV